MIVATAGHVDHGKTSLVKALTGIDTDRLETEKARGMSIDLGFAHTQIGGKTVAFIDVPGHERFVRNMVAGVASIDLALLVVAADDGPMPQTVEHVAILKWLGVADCVVALTKLDRADPAQVHVATTATAELLATTRFAHAPIIGVATPSGVGVEALRAALGGAAVAHRRGPAEGRFRLAVDRSFSMAGAGLVVTGAVVAGRVAVGDLLTATPSGHAVRVRAIQIHGQPAAEARAGDRCALNLGGVDMRHLAIGRGDWIVDPAAHAPTDRLEVRLGASVDLAKPLRHDGAVQLHLGAATVGARIALLAGRTLEPGAEALAQLVLERPIGALHGDRFIVRDPAANRTVGGGCVIDPFGWPRGRARPERLAELAALSAGDAADALAARLEQASAPIDLHRFIQARNLTELETRRVLQRQQAITVLRGNQTLATATGLDVGIGPGTLAIASARHQALQQAVVAALASVHETAPEQVGASEAALAAHLGRRADDAWLKAAIAPLLDRNEIVRDGFWLRLPDHRPRLSADDAALLERVGAVLNAAGLRPPIVGELATTLGLALPTLLGQLTDLARRGHLVQVARNRFFAPATVATLAQIAAELAAATPTLGFDAATYRDRTGLGRNLTIEVLEFLDRSGVTRFQRGRRRMIS